MPVTTQSRSSPVPAHDTSSGPTSGRSVLGLSVPQVLGGALAAATSALAASFLGVAGTLVGAVVGSVVATIGAAVYAHSLRKAATQLRVIRPAIRPDAAVASQDSAEADPVAGDGNDQVEVGPGLPLRTVPARRRWLRLTRRGGAGGRACSRGHHGGRAHHRSPRLGLDKVRHDHRPSSGQRSASREPGHGRVTHIADEGRIGHRHRHDLEAGHRDRIRHVAARGHRYRPGHSGRTRFDGQQRHRLGRCERPGTLGPTGGDRPELGQPAEWGPPAWACAGRCMGSPTGSPPRRS